MRRRMIFACLARDCASCLRSVVVGVVVSVDDVAVDVGGGGGEPRVKRDVDGGTDRCCGRNASKRRCCGRCDVGSQRQELWPARASVRTLLRRVLCVHALNVFFNAAELTKEETNFGLKGG